MRLFRTFLFFLIALTPALSNSNIENIHYSFSLTQSNRANVVRLCNDKKVVRYIFEAWLDGWEIDSPDDQLGGSLCIRINRAGGRYIPGCLLCREGAIKNYNPTGCFGIFTQGMLLTAFEKAKTNTPIKYVGHGMIVTISIKSLAFTDRLVSASSDHKVKELSFDLDIQPSSAIPESQPFKRIGD